MFEFIKPWLEVPEQIRKVIGGISAIGDMIYTLERKIEIAVPRRRLAFIWGTCSRLTHEGVSHKSQIHCEPIWALEGEIFSFYINPYAPIHNIELQINEPFLITDVCIGNCSQAVSIGACREWICSDTCNPGNRITIRAKWPMQPRGE